jgi:spore coat protein U-like protein
MNPSRRFALWGATVALWGSLGIAPSFAVPPVQAPLLSSVAVANGCVLRAVPALPFGTYDPTSGFSATGQIQVSLSCTKGTGYTLSVNAGAHGNTTLLGPSGNSLSYALYSDAGMSRTLGSSNVPAFTVTKPGICFSSYSATIDGVPPGVAFASHDPRAGGSNPGYFYGYLGQAASWSACPQGSLGMDTVSFGPTVQYGGTPPASGHNFIYVPFQANTITGTAASSLTPIQVPIYGKVAGGQNVLPGMYADSVILSVAF